MSPGTVELHDLRILCIVGIHPHERVIEQNLFLNVALDLNFWAAAHSDDVAQTVDYTEVASLLTDFVQQGKFQLVETIAVKGCNLLLERFPQVSQVRLAVHKPAAVPQARDTVVRCAQSR